MKKLIAISLVLVMALAFVGCGKKEVKVKTPEIETKEEVKFEKPKSYASVITVTINPKFNLYLDENGVVLAIEAINEDAEKIVAKITYKEKNVKEVIENLLSVVNQSGFIKEDVTVNLEITEKKRENVNTGELLNTVTNAVNSKMAELEIKVIIKSEDKTVEATDTESLSNKEDNKPVKKPSKKPSKKPVTNLSANTNSSTVDTTDVVTKPEQDTEITTPSQPADSEEKKDEEEPKEEEKDDTGETPKEEEKGDGETTEEPKEEEKDDSDYLNPDSMSGWSPWA